MDLCNEHISEETRKHLSNIHFILPQAVRFNGVINGVYEGSKGKVCVKQQKHDKKTH